MFGVYLVSRFFCYRSVMFSVTKEAIDWCGKRLVLEAGKIAGQADSAITVRYGDTVVLCTVTCAAAASNDASFFPLTVNYQEKFYAAGKFPGGFVKREGKPTDREVLVARLIDRPLRPLFPKDFFHEVQIVCTVLSFEDGCGPEIAALIGASAALCCSSVPFCTPIAMCEVAIDGDDNFVVNIDERDTKNSGRLALYVAGTKSGVLMVESEAQEINSKRMIDAILYGHSQCQIVIDMIERFASKCAKQKMEYTKFQSTFDILHDVIVSKYSVKIKDALGMQCKLDRRKAISDIRESVVSEHVSGDYSAASVECVFDGCVSEVMRSSILDDGIRIDGRRLDQIRDVECEVDVLPVVHGSALFTRGETQALVVTTLGSVSDEQLVDDIYGERKESFVLHYNFPPFAVGECGRLSAPSRREIGHGKLALRALHGVLPSKSSFPYSIRVVSEIMSSNGSSSMATVCGASMSLMASGVPIKSQVAGIAMGLVKDVSSGRYAILSDIMGDEDHLGDMDFKIAGTKDGITALQMDLKIDSIDAKILTEAVNQACRGLDHILYIMNNTIDKYRDTVSDNAPRIVNVDIGRDKIRDLIGPGGRNIKEICDTTGAKIEISDSGMVSVFATKKNMLDIALQKIKDYCMSYDVGSVVSGSIVKITDFGAFVSLGSKDGLLHISNISDKRLDRVEDVLHVGQRVDVKIIGLDERGRLKLSMKF